MRNYCRLWSTKGAIPCPQPVLLKGHVLLMQFVGEDGWPAPLLKVCYPLSLRVSRILILVIVFLGCDIDVIEEQRALSGCCSDSEVALLASQVGSC